MGREIYKISRGDTGDVTFLRVLGTRGERHEEGPLPSSCLAPPLPSLRGAVRGAPRSSGAEVGGVKEAGPGAGHSCQPTARAGGREGAGPAGWEGSPARDSPRTINPRGAARRRAAASPETLRPGVPPQEPHEGHHSRLPIHPTIRPPVHLLSVCSSLLPRLLPSHPAP